MVRQQCWVSKDVGVEFLCCRDFLLKASFLFWRSHHKGELPDITSNAVARIRLVIVEYPCTRFRLFQICPTRADDPTQHTETSGRSVNSLQFAACLEMLLDNRDLGQGFDEASEDLTGL